MSDTSLANVALHLPIALRIARPGGRSYLVRLQVSLGVRQIQGHER